MNFMLRCLSFLIEKALIKTLRILFGRKLSFGTIIDHLTFLRGSEVTTNYMYPEHRPAYRPQGPQVQLANIQFLIKLFRMGIAANNRAFTPALTTPILVQREHRPHHCTGLFVCNKNGQGGAHVFGHSVSRMRSC